MTIARPRTGVARDQLEALAGVVEDLAGQFDLHPLLDRILRHAADLLGCDSGSICTVDQQAGNYRKEVDLGVSCRSGNEFPLTEGVTGEILRAGGPVTFAEYSQVRGGHIDPVDRRELHGTIGVPIRWAGAVIGACIVFSRDPARRFGPDDVTLLELFAGHAGLAMVNARMHARAAELARAEATGLERERVVRDVHDSVARALASVVLHLDSAGDAAGQASGPPKPPSTAAGSTAGGPTAGGPTAAEPLDLARQAARIALRHTAQPLSSHQLSAHPLSTHPLSTQPTNPTAGTAVEDGIQAAVDRARGTGLDIRLVVAGPRRALPGALGAELVALGRQAIANIVAHADARTARVGLVYGAAEAVLLVQDDGIGFDLDEVPRPDGSRVGPRGPGLPELTEISERARALGGTVQIDATPGWGTTIRAAIPFRSVDESPPAPARRPTVLVVEHMPLVRAGLISLLQHHGDLLQVVGEVTGAVEALDAARLLTPDVVLIDVALPSGGAALTASLAAGPTAGTAAVVVIGEHTARDPRVREMLRAGARGVVMIDADAAALCRAVSAAARGDALFTDEVLHGLYDGSAADADEQPTALTPREREVRALVAQGLPDKAIAELLHISVKTVEKHVGAALRKTGARNRTELAAMTGRASA